MVARAGARAPCCTPTPCRRSRGSTSPRSPRRADLVAVSAHKFGGPKGVGALVVRAGVQVAPDPARRRPGARPAQRHPQRGRHRRRWRRPCRRRSTTRAATVARVAPLRDRLADGLLAAVPGAVETGDRSHQGRGQLPPRFEGVESEALLLLLDAAGVCAAAGSACASGRRRAVPRADGHGRAGRTRPVQRAPLARVDDHRRRRRPRARGGARRPSPGCGG